MAEDDSKNVSYQWSWRGRALKIVSWVAGLFIGIVAAFYLDEPVSILWLLGGVWICMVLGVAIAATIAIRRRVYWSTKPSLKPYDPVEAVLPEEVEQSLDQVEDELLPYGFRLLGHFESLANKPGQRDYVTVLDHAHAADRVWVWDHFAKGAMLSMHHRSYSIMTEFNDGAVVVTHNKKILVPLPGLPNRQTIWLPDVEDGMKLFKTHCAIIDHMHLGHHRVVTHADPLEHFQALQAAEIAHLMEIGHARFDDAHERYSLTWRGAISLVAKLLWPMKGIWQARLRRDSRRIVAQLPKPTKAIA